MEMKESVGRQNSYANDANSMNNLCIYFSAVLLLHSSHPAAADKHVLIHVPGSHRGSTPPPPASHHTANQLPPLTLMRCPECNAG